MNFGRWRSGCDAAKQDALHTERITCAKYRAHVVQASYVIEYNGKGQFVRGEELLAPYAPHFRNKFFLHDGED